jgi:hypothetical protein
MQGKKFLYYLINEQGLCYYLENGIVKTSNIPVPLDKTPDGWQGILLKWERNLTYYGINRNVSNSLSFVEDGAAILRYLFYTKNIEEKVYLLIQKRSLDIDNANYAFVYRFLYKGAIDLSTFKTVDISDGYKVSCNIAEDDFSKYLKAYEGTTYELPCNPSVPNAIPVLIDGVDYSDKFNFNFINVDLPFNNDILPTVFLNNEGDNFGILQGDQELEEFPNNAYFTTSNNFIFSSGLQAVTVRIKGKIGFEFREGVDTSGGAIDAHVALVTDLNQTDLTWLIGAPPEVGEGHDYVLPGKLYDFDVTITLQKNEKLFIAFSTTDVISLAKLMESEFSFSFTTRLAPTLCYCLRPKDVFKGLVDAMTGGGFTITSSLLDFKKNLVITSGDAIRGFDNSVIKLSFTDFFSLARSVLAAGITYDQYRNVEMEVRKKYFDNSAPIDLGIIRKAKFSLATDFTYNTLKAGYPPQNYDTVNGRQEYNTTSQFTAPITRITKELDLVSNIRADSYGIEGIRKNYKNLDTTSGPGDNDTFVLNIDDTADAEILDLTGIKEAQTGITNGSLAFDEITNRGGSENYFSVNGPKTQFTYINATSNPISIQVSIFGNISGTGDVTFDLKVNSTIINTVVVPASQGFFRAAFDNGVLLNQNDIVSIQVSVSGATVDLTSAGIDLISTVITGPLVHNLRRETYDSITGIFSPSTAYNIEDLTPKRIIKTNSDFIRSCFLHFDDQYLKFQTTDKNPLLLHNKSNE